MSKFESKNTILTKKLNNIIYELLVKTSSDMVYTDSSTTLTETLSDIGDILSSQNKSFEEVMADIKALTKGADKLQDEIKEIYDYVNVNGDPKSALIKMIEGKVDAEEGKSLTSNDFTDVLKDKLENGYTKEELDKKFLVVIDEIHKTDAAGMVQRIDALEKRVNIVVSTDDTAASKLPDGSIWYEVKQSNQTTE